VSYSTLPEDGSIESLALEGLDVAEGLKRVAGNQKLYRRLLRQFLEQQGGAPEEAAVLVTAGKREDVRALAHGIKGVAGNLGATTVQRAADLLEQAASGSGDQTTSMESALKEFTSVVQGVMRRLQTAIGATAPAAAPDSQTVEVMDPRECRRVIQEMLGYLEASDPAASTCLEASESAFRNLFSAEVFQQFEQALTEFSFDQASEMIRQAAEEKGWLDG